jgi:hypothetical protein
MTGYTVHTGSTVKFSNSWDRIFSDGPAAPASKPVAKKPAPAKKAAAKRAKKSRGA